MAATVLKQGVRSFAGLPDSLLFGRCIAANFLSRKPHLQVPSGSNNFHTCSIFEKSNSRHLFPNEPKKWPKYNDIVYPPRGPEEPRRPAEIFHYRANIKYSPKKMWYIAHMIKGMTIDEAVKQLSFVERKGAKEAKEVLLEAQEIAVRDHNVEYKSNLWIAESFAMKSKIIKGLRKHTRGRYGEIHYKYLHYFVCLREGQPPTHYVTPLPTGNEKMAEYIQDLRNRTIIQAL